MRGLFSEIPNHGETTAGKVQRAREIVGSLLALSFALVSLAWLAGCASSSSSSSSSGAPAVSAANPTSGTVGTAVTISGSNFGSSQATGSGTVTFNGMAAPVISWTSDSIVVDVPSGASTGNIVVTANGQASGGAAFTVVTTTGYGTCNNNTTNSATLSGTYAYLLTGFEGTGQIGTHFARAGSVTISGGAITGGQEDLNIAGSANLNRTINSSTAPSPSTFCVGADNRGTMTLNYSSGNPATFRFSIGSFTGTDGTAVRGHIIEFDDASGTGMHASGVLVQQNTADFAATSSNLATRYTFGIEGIDYSTGHIDETGTFTLAPGSGAISNGYVDVDDAGTFPTAAPQTTGSNGATTGTLSTESGTLTNGRTTLSVELSGSCSTTCTFDYVVYFINYEEAFMMSTDTVGNVTNTAPLVAGRMIESSSSLSSTTLTGEELTNLGFIYYGSGSLANVAHAEIGNLIFTAAGTSYSSTLLNYTSGVTPSPALSTGTFSVSAAGRVQFTPTTGTADYVFYLTNPSILDDVDTIAGYGIDESGNAAVGLTLVQQQAAVVLPTGTASPAALSFGSVQMADATVNNEAGEVGVLVGSAADAISGVSDQSSESGLSSSTFNGLTFNFSAAALGEITNTTDGDGHSIIGWADGGGIIFLIENGAASIMLGQQ